MSSDVSPRCLDLIDREKKSCPVLPYRIIIGILHTYLTTTEFLQKSYLNSFVVSMKKCKRLQSASLLAIFLREDWARGFSNDEEARKLREDWDARELMDEEAREFMEEEAMELMQDTLLMCNCGFDVYARFQLYARLQSRIAFGYTPRQSIFLDSPPECDIEGAKNMQKAIFTYTLNDAKTFLEWLSEVKPHEMKTKRRLISSCNRQLKMSNEQMRLLRKCPYALALLDK